MDSVAVKRGGDQPKRPGDVYYAKPVRKSQFSMDSVLLALREVRWRQLLLLSLAWYVLVHYLERTVVNRAIRACSWHKWEQWDADSSPHRVAIVGDPQIVDEYSYKTRPTLLLRLTQALSDNYLHRNYMAVHKKLAPHSVMFLGDLFDGGREWEDDVWMKEYKRFNRVFPPLQDTNTVLSIPGNHDIGFGNDVNITRLNRFRTMFGDANEYRVFGNHSFVLLDSISLSATESPEVSQEPTLFLESLVNDDKMNNYPRILLTHVPLYRFTEQQTCGPLRESQKRFPVARGKQDQTVLEYELSQRLLEIIQPKLIFSGDDHDYCHIRHPFNRATGGGSLTGGAGESYADEITVKTFAMTGGIKYPAVQLLSLWNPAEQQVKQDLPIEETGGILVNDHTFQTRMCYMPDPYHAIRVYSYFFLVSVVSLLLPLVFPRLCARLHALMTKSSKKKSVLPTILEEDRPWAAKARVPFWKDWRIPEKPNPIAFFASFVILVIIVRNAIWLHFSTV